jgi:hypothetical protein
MFRPAQGNMQGINNYVPAMQWSASLEMNACNTFSLGKPALASATAIATAVVTNTALNTVTYLATPWVADTPYGRPIALLPSGSVTATQDVIGEDYLGQPMIERFTWAAVGTAAVGKKSFYRVLGVKNIVAGGAITINIGTTGAKLGLPFKGSIEWAKEGAPPVLIDPATLFSAWTAPDVTDPATAITGDPRGQYTATAALDGLKEFIIGLRCDNSVNAAERGGLHGIRHYMA